MFTVTIAPAALLIMTATAGSAKENHVMMRRTGLPFTLSRASNGNGGAGT
jgi:hypothetical protein